MASLTREEIRAAKRGTVIYRQRNGVEALLWGAGNKTCSAMAVAQVRGLHFIKDPRYPREWMPDPSEIQQIESALTDVAEALGYEDLRAYNRACFRRPAEVRRRLKALR